MNVAIYSPYLDTFGGGEKYILTIAQTLSKVSQVDLLFDNNLLTKGAEKLKNDLAKRFDLDLANVKVVKAPLGKSSNILKRMLFLKKYDLFFYLTDGSIFYSTAKKNILHIQSPVTGHSPMNLWTRIKLNSWNIIIYNSLFTKNNCQSYWKIKSQVIYPPVDVEKIKPLKKKKYILSVGRFFGYLKDKKYEVLIGVFKDLYNNRKLDEWSLYLVGSAGEGDIGYLEELKDLAKGAPIKFYPNLEYNQLINLYGEASLYWHAAGFEENDPTKMEHFGISTVEAMAAGVVPVVINKGGQTEIVEQAKSGFLWDSIEDLKSYTIKLVKDINLQKEISKESLKRASNFSREEFEKKILELAK